MARRVDVSPGYVSEQRASRVTQLVTIVYLVVAVSYLWWRVTATVNFDALLLSTPFLAADLAGFGFFLLFAFHLWSRVERTALPPPEGLTVDVLIPTYNEDSVILRSTITAALAMRYPHRTYVLDDGRRAEVRELCAELGAEYLTRDDNKGAKAGNINAALPRTSGELIAIFDADHAPFGNFLTELLGYFRDPRVALVQAPQAYYNVDSFQHFHGKDGRGPMHEQSVFFDHIMPGKDRLNAAFWCGSGAVLRRSALEEVGGVNTTTITEDMHTAMLMHAAGWKSVYHQQVLAVGIAPDDASAFLVQRFRWASGAVQVLKRDNPLLHRGLSWRQRLSYFSSVSYVYEYVPKAVYLVTPVVALVFGVLPMATVGWELVARFVPYYLLGILTNRLLTQSSTPFFSTERFYLLKLWVMLRAGATLFARRPVAFQVTPKTGTGEDHRAIQLRAFRWQLMFGIANLVAVIWGAAAYALGLPWALNNLELAVTATWAAFNAGLVGALFAMLLKRHHRRKVYRFSVDLPGAVMSPESLQPIHVSDLSAIGVGFSSLAEFANGETVQLRIEARPGMYIRGQAQVTLARRARNEFRYGAQFVDLSPEDSRTLLVYLFQLHAPHIFQPQQSDAAPSVQLVPPPTVIPFPTDQRQVA